MLSTAHLTTHGIGTTLLLIDLKVLQMPLQIVHITQ